MKIKNPETGEVIVIPQGMEDAVRNAIESGNDPMEAMQMKYGGIHINPANKGKFNATKKATGKTTEELTHSNNPLTRKRAIFAQNAAKWKHEYGGQLPKAQVGDIIPADNAEFKKPYRTTDPEGRPYYDPGDYGVDYGNLTKQFNNSMGDYTNERLSGVDPQLRGGYRNFLENQYWEGGFNGVGNDGINVQDNNTQPTENPISLNPGTNNIDWGQSNWGKSVGTVGTSPNATASYNAGQSIYPESYSREENSQQNNGFNMVSPAQQNFNVQPYSGQNNSNFVSPMNPNYTSPQQQPSSQSMQGYDPGTNSGITNDDWKAYDPNASKFDWNSSPNQFSKSTSLVNKPNISKPLPPSLNININPKPQTLPYSGRPFNIGLKDNSFNERYNSQNILSGKSDLLGSHQNTNTTQNNKFNINHLFGPSYNK